MTFSLFMSLTNGTRLIVAGELDVNTVERLEPTLTMVVRRRPGHIEVELSRLRMIDSAGVGQLVGFCKRLRAAGCRPVIVGLRGQPLAVFQLLQLDRTLADPEIEAPGN
jgi:anti-sigma B factor antagonist